MVTPVAISRNLLVMAAFALLFCCDVAFWHNIPLGYEGMLAFGALSFWFGAAVTVVALALVIFGLVRHGRARPGVITLGCGLLLLISFVVVAILNIPVC